MKKNLRKREKVNLNQLKTHDTKSLINILKSCLNLLNQPSLERVLQVAQLFKLKLVQILRSSQGRKILYSILRTTVSQVNLACLYRQSPQVLQAQTNQTLSLQKISVQKARSDSLPLGQRILQAISTVQIVTFKISSMIPHACRFQNPHSQCRFQEKMILKR